MNIDMEMKYFLDRFLLGVSRRWRQKVHYEPLKVIFHMASPITLNHPWLHLDGLIAHLLILDALREDYYLLPRKFPFSRMLKEVDLPPMPIKRTKELYHASISFFDTDRRALEIYYKKFEDRWIGGGKKKRIYTGMGYFRNYMIQHLYLPAQRIKFYVNGDFNILNQIFQNVVGLGDNTRLGWGTVRKFEIKKMTKDYSIVRDGIAMRPIPIYMLRNTNDRVSMAFKPPYWAPESIAVCAPPGAKVKLK